MSVSIDGLKQALNSLAISLDLYKKSLNQDIEIQKAFRDACIQRFEYSIELCWKISMKILGSTTQAAKPAIREMARNNLIDNPERWLEFIESRNNTSHAYDEDIALAVFSVIEEFTLKAKKLIDKLEQLK